MGGLRGRDIISIRDFTREELDCILSATDGIESLAKQHPDLLRGRTLATLFFEPSTRTRLSFEAAMKKLGGLTLDMGEPRLSSVEKGENLADTVRVVENYVDVIALRHPSEGAAQLAAEMVDVPVINAGSGAQEHPTQAMLDLYTMKSEMGRIDGLTVGLLGDLRYGRTTHSLATALSMYKVKLYLISPELLKMRREVVEHIKDRIPVSEVSDLNEVLPELDVLYVTRIQKERFADPSEYLKVQGSFRIDGGTARAMRPNAIIMHPLPRIDEISPEVDSTAHARYFKQVYYGLLTRMTLLSLVLGAV
ncbi:MAG: aspartate carbamoyltransferase [Candidatus Bathyarchaeia archaeon]